MRSSLVVVGVMALVATGLCVLFWMQGQRTADDLRRDLGVARQEVTTLEQRLEAMKTKWRAAVKPSRAGEPLISESELRSLRERLRQAESDRDRFKKRMDTLVEQARRQQVGMKAAAKLQNDMRQEIRRAQDEIRSQESQLQKLRAEIQRLRKILQDRGVALPASRETGRAQEVTPSVREAVRLVSHSSLRTLLDWLASHLRDGDVETVDDLGAGLSRDEDLARALEGLMDEKDLMVAALRFARTLKSWPLERFLHWAARQQRPWDTEVVQLLGEILEEKARASGTSLWSLKPGPGLARHAFLTRLGQLPASSVPATVFLEHLTIEDPELVHLAEEALLNPARRGALLAAILDGRSRGEPLSSNLEAALWLEPEKTAASAVALAQRFPDLRRQWTDAVLAWGRGQEGETLLPVALEGLVLAFRGSAGDRAAWMGIWKEIWPEYRGGADELVGFLRHRFDRSDAMMGLVLMGPAFGHGAHDHPLLAERRQEMQLARRTLNETLSDRERDALFVQIAAEDQPLFWPLMEESLPQLSLRSALEVATTLFRHHQDAGGAWFRDTLARQGVMQRMTVLQRLFDIGTKKAHALARSIIGNGDPRATFRLVELGWEREVPMPAEDIKRLLRSRYLDPIRIDVFFSYFKFCLGERLDEFVTDALFDPEVARPGTLLDFFDGRGDQNLLPLFLRFLEHRRPLVRESALRAMQGLDLSGLVDRLMPHVRDEDFMVRVQLACVLGSLDRDPVARGGLLVLARDEHPFVRQAAVTALGQHQGQKLIPALRFAIGDEAADVAVAAAMSLLTRAPEDAKAADLLFRRIEDPWFRPEIRSFLQKRFGVDFKSRDAWRRWWAEGKH